MIIWLKISFQLFILVEVLSQLKLMLTSLESYFWTETVQKHRIHSALLKKTVFANVLDSDASLYFLSDFLRNGMMTTRLWHMRLVTLWELIHMMINTMMAQNLNCAENFLCGRESILKNHSFGLHLQD